MARDRTYDLRPMSSRRRCHSIGCMDTAASYFGDHLDVDPELTRLRALERVFDPVTAAVFRELGLPQPGWRCIELGAGAGSVARWLADRVGAAGTVVAVDANCRFLHDLPANVEVVESDVEALALGDGEFDLVHHRAVMAYLGGREEAVARAADALRPGAWLVSEEPVLPPADPRWLVGDTEDGAALRSLRSIAGLLEDTGMARAFGVRLPILFDDLGLQELSHRSATSVARGGSVESDLTWPMLAGLERFLVASGVARRRIATLRTRISALGIVTRVPVGRRTGARPRMLSQIAAPVGVIGGT